ncbi:MAG: TldD/PmbA family protein [Clostridiales bacterium]|jgi:predicted Zn-dependent protease|nr:TldD/PmbA family protein [Clostridiales bacterium]
MLDKNTAKEMVEKLCGETKFYATVMIENRTQDTTRFANSEISQNVSITDTVVGLTLYDGKKEATCTGNVLTDYGLEKLVKDAEDILRVAPEGEFEAFEPPREYVHETEGNARLHKTFGINERAALIKQGVAKIETGYLAAGALELEHVTSVFGDSKGCFRHSAYDIARFNTVVTHTASGAAGGGECVSYRDDDINIIAEFQRAQETARRARNPEPVPLGAYTVVLSPLAFGDLMSFVTDMFDAKLVDDGVSFAVGKLNERVFGENITVRDDVDTAGTQPIFFDVEGNRRQTVRLIENGVVKGFLYDNKTAARHGLKSSGHASFYRVISRKLPGGTPFNIVMDGGENSLAEIIKGTGKGIFINEFHYTNFVNPRTLQITGLTRNGAFLIENGELTKPVSTLRFTQNMTEALNRVTALSRERGKVSVNDAIYIIPAAKIEGFHFTGQQ